MEPVAVTNRPRIYDYFYPAYLAFISLTGILLVIWGIFHLTGQDFPISFILLVVLGIAAQGTATLTLKGIDFSVASTVSVAAVPFFGPSGGALIAAAAEFGLWIISIRIDKPSWKQAVQRLGFNVGVNSLSIYCAGLVFQLLVQELRIHPFVDVVIAWIIMIALADQINFWLVVVIVHLQHQRSPLEIWRDQKWAIPINIAVTGIGGGVLAVAIDQSGPMGVIIFFMPIVLSAYSFRLYVRRTEQEKEKLEDLVTLRTEDLAGANANLASANEELGALHEEKDAFLAVLSHDMRSPLTNIHGYVTMLMARPDISPEEREQMLQVVLRNEQVLLEIVNNILELRQLQTGGAVLLEQKAANIGLLSIEIIENSMAQALDKNIQLTYDINTDGDLQRYFAQVDSEKMKRVIQNLVSNAIKYTPHDGCVILRVVGGSQQVVIEVEDTGYGIPAEDLPRIFDSFHRVRTHQTLATGTGLGLSIVQMLIEAHKGEIKVESEVGKGSKFSVVLPKDVADSVPHPGIS
jgi:signal transduction histidine kinase